MISEDIAEEMIFKFRLGERVEKLCKEKGEGILGRKKWHTQRLKGAGELGKLHKIRFMLSYGYGHTEFLTMLSFEITKCVTSEWRYVQSGVRDKNLELRREVLCKEINLALEAMEMDGMYSVKERELLRIIPRHLAWVTGKMDFHLKGRFWGWDMIRW